MSDMSTERISDGCRPLPPPKFGTFIAAAWAGHTIAVTIIVGLAGLALNVPARRLPAPWAALVFVGLGPLTILYLARTARDRARWRSFVLLLPATLTIYIFSLMLGLMFGAAMLGVLSWGDAVQNFRLPTLLLSALVFVMGYFTARRRANTVRR